MTINIFETGRTYKEMKEVGANKMYNLILIEEEGLLKQKLMGRESLVTRKSKEWIYTNEPEDHLDIIAGELNRIIKGKRVLAFTYKDRSLMERLKNLQETEPIDILFDQDEGIVDQPPESCEKGWEKLANYTRMYDLIVVRHYLEHFYEPSKMIRMLKNMLTDNGTLYIEVPDTKRFISRGNPLFMWEEHKVYFTSETLKNTVERCGLNVIDVKTHGKSIEPAICLSCSRSKSNRRITRTNFQTQIEKIEEKTDKYINEWKTLIRSNQGKVIVVGAGHNSDRFMQLINEYKSIGYIIDDNTKVQGKFLLNMKREVMPFKTINNEVSPLVLSGCHDRSFEQVKEKIIKENPTAIVRNIFASPKEND